MSAAAWAEWLQASRSFASAAQKLILRIEGPPPYDRYAAQNELAAVLATIKRTAICLALFARDRSVKCAWTRRRKCRRETPVEF